MHQTRKGQQRYFGAKAYIGVDSKEVIVHSVITTAASAAYAHMLPDLLHGAEKKVWGDAGYQGQTGAIHVYCSGQSHPFHGRTKVIDWRHEPVRHFFSYRSAAVQLC